MTRVDWSHCGRVPSRRARMYSSWAVGLRVVQHERSLHKAFPYSWSKKAPGASPGYFRCLGV